MVTRGRLIKWLVPAGLVVCALANLWLEMPDALPGVALGAGPVLIVERTAVLFLVWVLVLLIVAEALEGRLPLEISGRGVRYADASTSEDVARAVGAAVDRMDEELSGHRQEQDDLRRLVFRLLHDRI